MNLRAKRKFINGLALTLSLCAMAFGLVWLVWILWMVIEQGVSSLALTLFTQDTPPPGEAGGLRNAIVGSAIMVGLAMAMATPAAVLAGIYLAAVGETRR